MNAPSNAKQQRVPLEQLAGKLIELLNSGPAALDNLASLAGYSRDVVRMRLLRLEEAGCARREKDVGKTGMRYIWHATGTPLPYSGGDASGNLRRDGQPHQVTIKTYPPLHHRHWMDVALFGPAERAAP